MPGQLKVGGNVIAEHTGVEGAGTVDVNVSNINASSFNGGQLAGMRNLIINGNFQVNQRNKASRTTTSSAYNYDRWYYDGTYLYQGVEDINVFNGTYTLSWIDAGSDITASYVVSTDTTANNGPDSGQTWTTVSNGGNITVNEATEYSKHLWVRFGGTLTNLSKVQLEVGSTATPFEHRTYGTELALCQRYYETIIHHTGLSNYGDIWSKPLNVFTNCYTEIRYKVEKRANPTFSIIQGSWQNLTPNITINNKNSIMFSAGGFFYLAGGSSGNPMAAVSAEI